MNFTRLNPLTGEVASEAPAMKGAQMQAVAEQAQQGFEIWSGFGPNQRRAILSQAAIALEGKKDDFVKAMMEETGATAGWAMFNLMLATSML